MAWIHLRLRAPLRAALRRFHELGGTVIDTAPQYRSSETVLGDLIAELDIRDDLFVATKTDKSGAADTRAQMENSALKLKTNNFDLMQVHNLIAWSTALPVMREWQQEKRIRYIGMSTSRAAQYEEFEAVMRKEKLDFIQINYSLEQREAADRILPLAAELGVAVIINRAFGGGRIFEAVGEHPLPDWAKEFGCESWAQFLLKYAVGHPAATLAIPGMTKTSGSVFRRPLITTLCAFDGLNDEFLRLFGSIPSTDANPFPGLQVFVVLKEVLDLLHGDIGQVGMVHNMVITLR